MAASAPRRAAAAPIPAQISTISPFSKKRKRRPSCSLSVARQLFTSGRTSRSKAATIATLGISVSPKPFHSAPHGIFDGHNRPTEFSLGLGGTGKHLLLSHANRIDGCTRLAAWNQTAHRLVDNAGREREHVRQLDRR